MVNVTTVAGSNTWTSLFANVNTVSEGLFGLGVIFALFFITYILFLRSKEDFLNAWIAASFIGTIASLFLFGFGMVGMWAANLMIINFVGSLFVSYFRKS